MSELKACPFCGGNNIIIEEALETLYCDDCGCELAEDFGGDWNTRPIEDALNARIAELEAEVTKGHELQDAYCDRIAELEAEKCVLIDQRRETKNILVDKKLHIDSLYEEGYKLQQRIAELEAENKGFRQLIRAWIDIFDPQFLNRYSFIDGVRLAMIEAIKEREE